MEEVNNEAMEQFARIFFIHQIAEGKPLDVTIEHPQLDTLLSWAEKEQLIEVDVKRAAYKLTEKGKQLYKQQLEEAQELVKRYDVYGDVDEDLSGTIRFDTGLGRDLRVPILELEGVDPFRARFLIGLNDDEWKESDWWDLALKESWYDEVFAPIESAPAPEEIGEPKLRKIMDEGKHFLRKHEMGSAFESERAQWN